MNKVYLSRRNLLSLLSKLNRQAAGESTFCTIIKRDDTHAKYPQTMPEIEVIAVEDVNYYFDRPPGEVHPVDCPKPGLGPEYTFSFSFDRRLIEREENAQSEYGEMTELDWAEYQFATIEYDYQIHPSAAKAIRAIFEQLYRPMK